MKKDKIPIHFVYHIPDEITKYFNEKYSKSEGFTLERVYWYHSHDKNEKYYGIVIYKNGKLFSYPQDTLQGFLNSLPQEPTEEQPEEKPKGEPEVLPITKITREVAEAIWSNSEFQKDLATSTIIELKETIKQLIEVGELEDITFTDKESTEEFQTLIEKAKKLSL